MAAAVVPGAAVVLGAAVVAGAPVVVGAAVVVVELVQALINSTPAPSTTNALRRPAFLLSNFINYLRIFTQGPAMTAPDFGVGGSIDDSQRV
jgi:hypothetical protein